MRLTSLQKRRLRWFGYPLLALVTFFFAFSYTFPYDRLKETIEDRLRAKYDVSIGSIEPGFLPGTFTMKTFLLTSRPSAPGAKPVSVFIDEVEVNIGVLSAIFWTRDWARLKVDVDAVVEGGRISLSIEHDKGDESLVFEAHTEMLPLGGIPGIAEAVGLPVAGGLNADFELNLPGGKWKKADGRLQMSCVDCTVGDGVAKMKMRPNPALKRRQKNALIFQGDGVTVPQLRLGSMVADIEIKDGTGRVKTLTAKSDDGFLKITGDLEFQDPFANSTFPACLTFGFSDALKKREPKFMAIEAGIPERSTLDDGSYAIPMVGKIMALRPNPRQQCGDGKGTSDNSNDTRAKKDPPRIISKEPSPFAKPEPPSIPTPNDIIPEPPPDIEPESPDDETMRLDATRLRKLTPDDVALPEPVVEGEDQDEAGGGSDEEGDGEEAGDEAGDEEEEPAEAPDVEDEAAPDDQPVNPFEVH